MQTESRIIRIKFDGSVSHIPKEELLMDQDPIQIN